MTKLIYIRILAILYFTVFLFFQVAEMFQKKGNKKTQKKCRSGLDLLFDGETLEGWEVTQFGTQGPVQVSDGNIVWAWAMDVRA
jgi:hypothetical protein